MDNQNNPIVSTEAPASWNTRYTDPSGFECQLTLRAQTGSGVLKIATAALKALVDMGCAPAQSHNGNDKPQPDVKVCTLHDCVMSKHERNGEVWWSHKLASDGTYCKGGKK